MELNDLVGKKVKEFLISEDKTVIKIICEDGQYYITAYGSCCSDSWFDHIYVSYASYPLQIIATEEIELGKVLASRQFEDQLYGYVIKMKSPNGWKEEIKIEMRNSSNGYYGGSINVGHIPLDQYNKPISEDSFKFVKLDSF